MSQSAHIIAKDAALIATFYGNQGKLQPLLKRLRDGFAPLKEHAPNLWLHEPKQISLRLFDPPAAQDTSIIQLTLTPPAGVEVQEGWAAMGWRLGKVLDQEDQEAYLSQVWGYTLVYQALIATESWHLVENQDEAGLDELFARVRRLHVISSEPPARLAHSVVQSGTAMADSCAARTGRLRGRHDLCRPRTLRSGRATTGSKDSGWSQRHAFDARFDCAQRLSPETPIPPRRHQRAL